MHRATIAALLLLSQLLAACADGGHDTPGATRSTVRDSAGITIVESSRPVWGPDGSEAWTVDPTPAVTIGAVDGDAPYLFQSIAGVQRLADGGLVVADRGSSQLRYFAADGGIVTVTGGFGQGPGEFEDLAQLARLGGDTLLAIDASMASRLTTFDAEGQLVDTFGLGNVDANVVLPVTASRSGAVLGFGVIPVGMPPGPRASDSLRLYLYPAPGAEGNELVRLPFLEHWISGGASPSRTPIPFAARGVWTAADSGFVTGGAATSELHVWSDAGRLQRIIRWSAATRPVLEDDLTRYREQNLAGIRNENTRRTREAVLREIPAEPAMPAYQSLLVDELGAIWVEQFRAPWEEARKWTVLDASGSWLGELLLPDRFQPMYMDEELVLGVWRDDNDVEFVHGYRLLRN